MYVTKDSYIRLTFNSILFYFVFQVVSAYMCIVSWLTAVPMLAECESVLHTVAEAVQLGVTGARTHVKRGEIYSKICSINQKIRK